MGALKELSYYCLFLKVADVLTTLYLVSHYGTEVEVNPFMKLAMHKLGVVWSLGLNAAIYSTIVCILFKTKRKSLLWVVLGMMLAVVGINISGMILHP